MRSIFLGRWHCRCCGRHQMEMLEFPLGLCLTQIENAENLEKSMFSAEFLASLRGFEPPAYRLGETKTKSTSV